MTSFGSYGVVEPHNEKDVIKKFHRSFFGIFIREVSVSTYLTGHPNIVRLQSYIIPQMSIIYEKLDFTLSFMMKKNYGDDSERAKILTDVLYGLDFIHSHGLIHGDVKPQNIMIKNDIDSDGYRRFIGVLIDWSSSLPFACANFQVLTPIYAEPCSKWKDEKTFDIYSIGIVCLELFGDVTFIHPPGYMGAASACKMIRSRRLRELVSQMLIPIQENRITAKDALKFLGDKRVEQEPISSFDVYPQLSPNNKRLISYIYSRFVRKTKLPSVCFVEKIIYIYHHAMTGKMDEMNTANVVELKNIRDVTIAVIVLLSGMFNGSFPIDCMANRNTYIIITRMLKIKELMKFIFHINRREFCRVEF